MAQTLQQIPAGRQDSDGKCGRAMGRRVNKLKTCIPSVPLTDTECHRNVHPPFQ